MTEPTLTARTTTVSSTVRLAIEGKFCGPVSVGSIKIIDLVRTHACLSLTEAKDAVDRCVFAGETVDIPMPSQESAQVLIESLNHLPDAPTIHASVLE